MPRRSPFTTLCQTLGRPPQTDRADLHVHSTHSDGLYTPAELIDLASRSGLAALAITDHDTLAAVPEAQAAAAGRDLEVVPAVEITADFDGREVHLLAYFVDPNDGPLTAALARLRHARVSRFRQMFDRLRDAGVPLREEDVPVAPLETLGRPHLARLIVQAGRAGSVREAIQRFLLDGSPYVVPKVRLPLAGAVGLVRDAGGVTSLAHPWHQITRDTLRAMRDLGLTAVEAAYPDFKTTRSRQLRAWAGELGLAVSGGSDCHGPGRRPVGSHTVSRAELEALRQLSRRTV